MQSSKVNIFVAEEDHLLLVTRVKVSNINEKIWNSVLFTILMHLPGSISSVRIEKKAHIGKKNKFKMLSEQGEKYIKFQIL